MSWQKRIAQFTVQGIANAGLSGCLLGGDPPPPPLECSAVDGLQGFDAYGDVAGTQLTITVRNYRGWEVSNLMVENPVGARLIGGAGDGGQTPSDGGASDAGSTHIDAGDSDAKVTETLPLRARQEARIALVQRGDEDVHLEARTPYQGAHRVEWTVSDGEIVTRDGARLHWRLPDRTGLYQVELLIDYGDDGFALDTMTLEIG